MTAPDQVYAFAFRGLLAEEALDSAGRTPNKVTGFFDEDIAEVLSLDVLDESAVQTAKQMAAVYTAIAAFENSVRKLMSSRLLEESGDGWWISTVPEKIRTAAKNRQDAESKIRWHTPRGDDPINYTDFGHLVSIIQNNWTMFEPYFRSVEWVRQIFDNLERSRNVIMHSGVLAMVDIERIGMNIRDWVAQVGD
ncbi:MAG: hypothetical protein GIW94_11465 [Candidatus Eremiobacteraeota bacterium]|nr:hypothetical protein [Candidatus Eremiobacteraeota bacterium]